MATPTRPEILANPWPHGQRPVHVVLKRDEFGRETYRVHRRLALSLLQDIRIEHRHLQQLNFEQRLRFR